MNNPSFKIYLLAALLSIFAAALPAAGQHDPYEVLFNGTFSQEGMRGNEIPITSEELFREPLAGESSLFGELSRQFYLPVRYTRAGINNRFSSVTVLGLDISGNLNTSADYNLWSALGRSKLDYRSESEAYSPTPASFRSSRVSYSFNPVTVRERVSAGVFTTNRKGRLGFKAGTSGTVGRQWTYMLDLYRVWGRDGTVKGVFTDRLAYSAVVSGSFGKHRVVVFSAGDYSEDGLRSYITRETVDLAGSSYYNPSWGLQDGKVRNSRVSKGFIPLTAVSYEGKIARDFSLTASVGYRGGESSVGGLSWLDAPTPYPDYYRYMPSYASSQLAEEIIRRSWASADPSVTQVDWARLYETNSLNPHTTVYSLSGRVEQTRELQGFLQAAWQPGEKTVLSLALRARKDDVRRFRRMKDLLGGVPPYDIDQYLYDDEIYGGQILNDVRNPYRKVNEGDIFGYDYDVFAREAAAVASVEYSHKGLKMGVIVSYGKTSFARNGRFEKEIYPGPISYGNSDKMKYENYTAEIRVRYAFDSSHSIAGHAHAGTVPQQWAVHFITPMYSNRQTGVENPVRFTDYRMEYSYHGRNVSCYAAVFQSDTRDIARTYNYWDYISSAYSTMLLHDMQELNRGIELAADYDLDPRWNISALFSWAGYKYASDPTVTIFAENTLESYVSGAISYLKGYHTANSPETVLNLRAKYSASGFIASVGFNHAGGRYVSPGPLRRMQRAYNLAISPESIGEFMEQEKLPDAFTVDASVLKSFRFREKYLTLFLSVSNLLNNKDIIYAGYEQLRVARKGSGVNAVWSPFPNKYLYSHGRTYYASLTYTF